LKLLKYWGFLSKPIPTFAQAKLIVLNKPGINS
jgi:hypothetical protein